MSNVISYLHPHMQTSIVDNSTVPTSTVSVNGPVAFFPYFSSRGVDGVIERYDSYAKFLVDKGLPNFKKHGQSIYNILQFLRGGGIAYCIRLLPTDAAAAEAVLLSDVTVGEDGVITVNKGDVTVEEGEGTERKDLVKFSAKGKGIYGNKIALGVSVNDSLSKAYGVVIYDITVTENNVLVEGPYHVSLQPEAIDISGASLYIKNIFDEYSDLVDVEVNETLYDETIEKLLGNKLNGEDITEDNVYSVDILALQFVEDSKAVAVSIALENGSDGTYETETKESLLIKAFTGEIENKKQYPIDLILDAGYSKGVKEAILGLSAKRKDFFTYLDEGILEMSTPTNAITERPETDDRTVAIFAQHFVIYDSFTNSDIKVTMPYFLAYKIPANDLANGMHYPLAGPNRGLLTGFKKMSFNPTEDEKEELYRKQINYAEQDYRTTRLMSQLTAQEANTALSNINNMRVLLRMIRRVEEISENYFFEFANADTLNHFQESIKTYLSSWVHNGACISCDGTVYQNSYDVAQRIVRVRVEVVFTGIIERIVIEFNVGNNA